MRRTGAGGSVFAAIVIAAALGGVARANPSTQDPSKVPAGVYVLDKRHASLTARIAHMGGFSRFTLRFNGLDGGFTYDPANWQATKVSVTVDPKSIDTGNPPFDKQIAGYFEADKFPAISFSSTAITDGGDGKGTLVVALHVVGRQHLLSLPRARVALKAVVRLGWRRVQTLAVL